MSRVLVTGGVGTIGSAIVRRLLGDPAYEVRVADQRPAPMWMREGCEVHTADLRLGERARAAVTGCTHVVHLAAISPETDRELLAHTLIEANNALIGAVIRAALDEQVERFLYVSRAEVYEHADLFPTPEEQLAHCPAPSSAYAFSKLSGEVYCRAAQLEHGLPYTICRAADPYGPDEAAAGQLAAGDTVSGVIFEALGGKRPFQIRGSGEQTRTPTHVEDIAAGVLAAMSLPGGLNEVFNVCAAHELTVAEIARLAWEAAGEDPDALAFEQLPALVGNVQRRWPAAQKARELLGWEAQIEAREGIPATVRRLRDLGSIGSRA